MQTEQILLGLLLNTLSQIFLAILNLLANVNIGQSNFALFCIG